MAGLGFNNRGGMMDMGRRRGLGLDAPFTDAPYTGSTADEFAGSDEPYAGDASDEFQMADEGESGGDGWTEAQRAFLAEVEADTQSGDLYEGMDEWRRKWMERAQEFGLSPEDAMRVLDSMADFDNGDEEGNYAGPFDEMSGDAPERGRDYGYPGDPGNSMEDEMDARMRRRMEMEGPHETYRGPADDGGSGYKTRETTRRANPFKQTPEDQEEQERREWEERTKKRGRYRTGGSF